MSDPPDEKTLLEFHQRLRRGDRLALTELASAILPSLQDQIARKFPGRDEQIISDGVIDAILDYGERPEQFNADKRVPLGHFLAMAAGRNVANLLRGERRLKWREKKAGAGKPEADVAFDPVAGNIRQEELRELEAKKKAMFDALTNPKDKDILALRLDGVKDTTAFARILGVGHLSEHQQRKEVKRHKDRIVRFLRRKGLLP